jgi:hypothetical protein
VVYLHTRSAGRIHSRSVTSDYARLPSVQEGMHDIKLYRMAKDEYAGSRRCLSD